ncbi:MAG TPA: SOS response-associated peptidase [Longimicrobiaceae bacterium]|nr:SOS response-associated peptidase [Longimicrobiaceae bacterium]
MCGRYGETESAETLARRFGAALRAPATGPRYNIAPTQHAPVLVRDGGGLFLSLFRWGLRPGWARDGAPEPINARSEDAAGKPYFRAAWRSRRCVVPASGFYEWRKTADGKVPHWIRRADGEPLTLAGLWEVWTPRDAEPVHSFCILTTGPNEAMRPIHDRMPVILDAEERDTWLDPGADPAALQPLMRPWAGELRAHPVSTRVNSPRNDGPELIEQAG